MLLNADTPPRSSRGSVRSAFLLIPFLIVLAFLVRLPVAWKGSGSLWRANRRLLHRNRPLERFAHDDFHPDDGLHLLHAALHRLALEQFHHLSQ